MKPHAALRRDRETRAACAQQQAANPGTSVWVSASAGTGKTKVLTDRVLSLLLHGTQPSRILCLTFTKAAAAEMANRLAERLAWWATTGDASLARELRALLGRDADEVTSSSARRLFARVLDAPGGLRIQTIHSFCQSLLARFPLEAVVAPHFQVLDDRSAAEMLETARIEVLARTHLTDDPDLTAAMANVTVYAQEQKFTELLAELIKERGRLARLLRRHGGIDGFRAAVCRVLGVDPNDSAESLLVGLCHDAELDCEGLQRARRALAAGTQAEIGKSETLRIWLEASPEKRASLFASHQDLFLTREGQPRVQLLTNGADNAVSGAADAMAGEARRLQEVCAKLKAVAVARSTGALLRLGHEILATYERHKRSHSALDYDDLILKTVDLLRSQGMSPWVLYKLDGGIDHVLIDEAQDTNPEQWQVIETVTEEFFAGEGARQAGRTVFAVGDGKQSIFSFQRADPAKFAEMRDFFSTKITSAGQHWSTVDLDVSFRSTSPVLRVVDAVFACPEAQDGVIIDGALLCHDTARVGQAGLVEVWPPADPSETEALSAWEPPVVRSDRQEPRMRLAKLIAKRIWYWTTCEDGGRDPAAWLDSQGRRLRPGDFLVLVRRRNEFVAELVRELKQLEVPVAGVDRMVLTDQLAVMDLVALGRVLLLPEDDLTLATVLKGPLIGLTEDQLFDLAYGRTGNSLWAELRRRRGEQTVFGRAYDDLAALRARTDFLRSYELFAEILGPMRGREKLLARLGRDANDPIEEFLSLALAHEREHVPSLQGFLHWLEAGCQEIKRDLEHGDNAVRIMTVHGAKGLQAPVVFLPDTLQEAPRHDGLLWSEDEGGLVFWPLKKKFDGPSVRRVREATRHAQEGEYRRLLYVALTRAEDRLYVCGWNSRQTAPEGCWYNLVKRAMEHVGEQTTFDFQDEVEGGWAGIGWQIWETQGVEPERRLVAPEIPTGAAMLPGYFREVCPTESVPARPLAPSRPVNSESAARSPTDIDDGYRFQRGRLIHRLLQFLPDISQDRRDVAGRRYLAQPVHGLNEDQQARILADTLNVLGDPRFGAVFGPDSRAEVPIAGALVGRHGPQVVSGQLDRLVVTDQEVMVIDYKTNQSVPMDETDVPALYLRQMAAYRALLKQIYDGKPLKCLLLWTEGPRLMQISDAALADHAP